MEKTVRKLFISFFVVTGRALRPVPTCTPECAQCEYLEVSYLAQGYLDRKE